MYDSKCRELAEHFLSDYNSEHMAASLAQWIQDAVEDWLLNHEQQLTENRVTNWAGEKARPMATMAEEPLIEFIESVIQHGFMLGSPDALSRATNLINVYTRQAVGHVRSAALYEQKAAKSKRQALRIRAVVDEYRPHWTPRLGEAADNLPTPETVSKSRKRHHDPIKSLHENGRITDEQKRAAENIGRIFTQISRMANFKTRNLEAGRPPKHSGQKPAMLSDDVAVEHRLIYKPWASQVYIDEALSLPLAIAIVVDCMPIRQCRERFHVEHDTVIALLKGALDLYIKFDKAVSRDERDELKEKCE